MSKRYNKSESRKDRPYNKSRHRRPHPPYDESKSRDRAEAQALEMERGDALDFDLNIPDVDWKLPTVPDVNLEDLSDIPTAKTDTTPTTKPKPNDPLERPEFEVKPKAITKPKAPQSLGQKPKPLTKEQQIQREMQRRQAAKQKQRPQNQRNKQVHPAAIVGPVIIMFIVMAFLSTVGVPPIVYLFVLLFFGRQVWNVIQGGGK